MHYMTEAALEASANAWHRAFEPKAETTLAAEIEAESANVRARLSALDLMSDAVAVDDDDKLVQLVRAGKFDEAGAEWARRLSAYCVECGEYACGVQ